MATNNSWSAAAIAKLKSLFDKGLSTAEIGKRLGFTKNAIVGKINRLGLNMKKNAAASKADPAAKKRDAAEKLKTIVKKAKSVPKKETVKSRSESKRKTERIIRHSAQLMSLKSDQCRWPTGDPDSDDFRFCGEKCFTGKPYCFEHCKVAYQFAQPMKKK